MSGPRIGFRVLRRVRSTVAYETAMCLAVALVVEVGLRVVRLPVLAARLGVRLTDGGVPTEPPAAMPGWTQKHLQGTWRVTSRWPAGPEGKCLRTSLVAGQRLRRLQPELVIGVRRGSTGFGAHAWLVIAGGSLDPSAADFVQLPVRSA